MESRHEIMGGEVKICKLCSLERDLRLWFRMFITTAGNEGFDNICRSCRTEQCVARKREKVGFTETQLQLILKSQNGCCAICDKATDLHADHNHETNKPRGLLCGECNRGLGLFYDKVEWLQKAIDYLRKHQ